MSSHSKMPPMPPANRSPKERGDAPEARERAARNTAERNTAEQGETANIRQNTTNAGYFRGRRMKWWIADLSASAKSMRGRSSHSDH
jgi:hypothetical protein